jgi:hypothetical protein
MSRLRPLLLASVLSLLATPALALALALAATSHVKLWRALENDVFCGVAIHAPGKPATQVLCSGAAIPPPPRGVGFGDPGFVFLDVRGRPILARLSQDSFEGSTPVALADGSTWSKLGITCRISATRVRCANRSGHGFTIGKHSYKAF